MDSNTTRNQCTECLSNTSQVAVWQSFKNGNVEALENIYTEYFDLLCLYGRQFATNDPLLVEDCIQDLFIQLYTSKNKNNLSDTTSIKFYLMKSLRRSILNRKRRDAKKIEKTMIEINNIDELGERVEDINDGDEIRSVCLREYVLRLPKRQRDAICLRFFSELGFREIALKMHLSVKSVYKVIYKGLDNLRMMYKTRIMSH